MALRGLRGVFGGVFRRVYRGMHETVGITSVEVSGLNSVLITFDWPVTLVDDTGTGGTIEINSEVPISLSQPGLTQIEATFDLLQPEADMEWSWPEVVTAVVGVGRTIRAPQSGVVIGEPVVETVTSVVLVSEFEVRWTFSDDYVGDAETIFAAGTFAGLQVRVNGIWRSPTTLQASGDDWIEVNYAEDPVLNDWFRTVAPADDLEFDSENSLYVVQFGLVDIGVQVESVVKTDTDIARWTFDDDLVDAGSDFGGYVIGTLIPTAIDDTGTDYVDIQYNGTVSAGQSWETGAFTTKPTFDSGKPLYTGTTGLVTE